MWNKIKVWFGKEEKPLKKLPTPEDLQFQEAKKTWWAEHGPVLKRYSYTERDGKKITWSPYFSRVNFDAATGVWSGDIEAKVEGYVKYDDGYFPIAWLHVGYYNDKERCVCYDPS